MKSFLSSWDNFLSFALALVPSILLWIFQPNQPVPFVFFAILLLITMLSVWYAIKCKLRYSEISAHSDNLEIIQCIKGRCVCKNNSSLAYNSIVSFYRYKENFEELIGYGLVETIPSNNFAQIIPNGTTDDIDDLYEYIESHTNEIKIKSTLTMDTIEYIKNNFY